MTLSRLEQSRREIKRAARLVAARDGDLWNAEAIAEAVAEEIGWEFSEDEKRVALDTYREAVA